MKILKMILLMILFTSNVYAYYGQNERVSVLKEYIMMKICIDDNDTILTSYVDARNNCACAIEKIPHKIIRSINSKKFSSKYKNALEDYLSEQYERCED